MKSFKFLHNFQETSVSMTGIVYGWNVYEQKVMNIYKFCYDCNVEFIGFYQNFIENDEGKVLTILNIFSHGTGRVIAYEIWDGRRSIYTLRISNEDLISIQEYETV